MLSSASDKAKFFALNFSWNSNLDDSVISPPVFHSRTNQKLHNISVTHSWIKKVITNLDLSKACSPNFISVVILKNCERERTCIQAELCDMCLKESCFLDYWKSHWLPLYLRMLGKGLRLKTSALLVFFLWLVKSLKNL